MSPNAAINLTGPESRLGNAAIGTRPVARATSARANTAHAHAFSFLYNSKCFLQFASFLQ